MDRTGVIFLDTNVFFSPKRLRQLAGLADENKFVINDIVVYEFIDVLSEKAKEVEEESRKEGYRRKIREFPSLLETVNIKIESLTLDYESLREVTELMGKKRIEVGDALICIHLRKMGIKRIMTDDKDWKRITDEAQII